MTNRRNLLHWPVLALSLALGACGAKQDVKVAAPAPVAIPPRPTPPEGAFGYVPVPPRDAAGAYVTPNRALSQAQTIWHVRAALNVAALGCRGPEQAAVIASYNQLLDKQKKPLAKAYAAVQASAKKEHGSKWQTPFDQSMTRLYNFFSLPFAKSSYCAAAARVAARTATLTSDQLDAFAAAALPELERPLTDFFADYERYRVEAAAWDANYGKLISPPTVIASVR